MCAHVRCNNNEKKKKKILKRSFFELRRLCTAVCCCCTATAGESATRRRPTLALGRSRRRCYVEVPAGRTRRTSSHRTRTHDRRVVTWSGRKGPRVFAGARSFVAVPNTDRGGSSETARESFTAGRPVRFVHTGTVYRSKRVRGSTAGTTSNPSAPEEREADIAGARESLPRRGLVSRSSGRHRRPGTRPRLCTYGRTNIVHGTFKFVRWTDINGTSVEFQHDLCGPITPILVH